MSEAPPEGTTRSRILFVFGTRPEAIKMIPVVNRLAADPARFEVLVCVTGQHRAMLDEVLEVFGIVPAYDLEIMQPDQSLTDITTQTLQRLAPILASERPDWVFVQGDTTSTFAASLAAFYARIPVAHVEAGLRTGDVSAPYPEEMNRVLTSRIATVHFAPTETARENLLREGIAAERIVVTGNTVIDALLEIADRIEHDEPLHRRLEERFAFLDPAKRLILATAHRRENFGEGLEAICRGFVRIVREHDDVEILLPVHRNPNVREPVQRILGPHAGRIHLVDPVDYPSIVYLMNRATLILTDSGGMQEEAPLLGKPVLVLRHLTERPEGVDAGAAMLVGPDEEAIAREARRLLTDSEHYGRMSRSARPYGSGDASRRIADFMSRFHD